ncbi:hypothetical protein EC991_000277, partial [Linnemannia zychae]
PAPGPSLGPLQGHQNFGLLGRSDYHGDVQIIGQGTHIAGHQHASTSGLPDQQRQVRFTTHADSQTSRLLHQHAQDDSHLTQGQGARVEAGGISPMDVDDHYDSTPSIIHRQGSGSHASSPSSTPSDTTSSSMQGPRLSFWSRLVQQHSTVQGGAQRHRLVAQPPPILDRPVFPSSDSRSGSLYGRFRLGLGDCSSQQGDLSPLATTGIPTVDQLARAQDGTTCRSPPRGSGESDSDPLGQYNNSG